MFYTESFINRETETFESYVRISYIYIPCRLLCAGKQVATAYTQHDFKLLIINNISHKARFTRPFIFFPFFLFTFRII